MSLPTLIDHNNEIGIEAGDRRPYLERYVEAKNIELAEKFADGSVAVRHTLSPELARLAFTFVKATFRLIDIQQSNRDDNADRVKAQQADVDVWTSRVDAVTTGYVAFHETIDYFTRKASDARLEDDEETRHKILGLQNRAGEIVVEAEPDSPLSWTIPDVNPPNSVFDLPKSKQEWHVRERHVPPSSTDSTI